MSAKDRQGTNSADLVLIGDYLRGQPPADAARGVSAPDAAPNATASSSSGVNAALLLLDAVVEHATYPRVDELKDVAAEMVKLRDLWQTQAPAPDQVQTACELLRRQRELKDQRDAKLIEDVHDIVVIFHRAISALAQGSRRNLGRLGRLENDLDQAGRLPDLTAIRAKLSGVLEYIRVEREEERTQATRIVERLKRDFEAIEITAPETGAGLSGKDLAVATLRRAWAPDLLVAVVHLEQVRGVIERHGQETAQRLCNEVLSQVAQRVSVPYSTYNWDQSTVLLVFEAVSNFEPMRRFVTQHLAAIPATFILDVAARKTLFRFPHHWLVIGHTDEPSADKAVRKIEEFLAAHEG